MDTNDESAALLPADRNPMNSVLSSVSAVVIVVSVESLTLRVHEVDDALPMFSWVHETVNERPGTATLLDAARLVAITRRSGSAGGVTVIIIGLVLTLLFWLPGALHALWVISTVGEQGREAAQGTQTFIALLVAYFLPPVAVLMRRGLSLALLVNLLLTLLFFVPGQVHAVWVVVKANR